MPCSCSHGQRCPKIVPVTAYKAPPHPSLPSLQTTMNLKSLAALTLAASAVPLATAGPLAYALCQTGAFPPTIIRLCTHVITRLQRACSLVLRCCRFHFRGDHCCGAPRHHGLQRWVGNLHGSVCCDSTHCPNPLKWLVGEYVACPRDIRLTVALAYSSSSTHSRWMLFPLAAVCPIFETSVLCVVLYCT